jgi:type IV pilus assembly protein PilE
MNNKFRQKKINKGFTLIELLIVITIVGILTVIVSSNFSSQTQRTHRTDAKVKLFDIMQRQEKYFSENNTYTTTLSDLGYSTNITDNGFYKITAKEHDDGLTEGVILTASPQKNQTKDTECGSLILNSNGIKSVTGKATNCW